MELSVKDYGDHSAIVKNSIITNFEEALNNEGGVFYYLSLKSGSTYFDLVIKGSDYDDLSSKIDMIQNGSVFVEGYVDENNYIVAEKIGGITLKASKAYLETVGVSGLKYFSQEVKLISTQEIYNITKNSVIYQSGSTIGTELVDNSIYAAVSDIGVINFPYVSDAYLETHEKDGVSYTLTENPYGENKQVNFLKEIKQFNRIIVVSTYISLQSVDEVVEVIIKYIPVFLMLSLLFATITAVIFSRKVTKPILSLANVADQMANMELDVVSQIKSNDELGALSDSLNTLASNLKHSMSMLVEQNEQLSTKFELKQQQEAARKVFVANVSHELKTPLGVIKSYMEAIKDGVKIEKQQYYMNVILDEISNMDAMIGEMLTLSKFDEGMMKFNPELFDMDVLAKEIYTVFEEQLKNAQIELDIKMPLGKVIADQDKIYQVLINLVSNAVKYGTRNSTIRIESIQKNKQIEFYVNNECTPFTEEELEKVWERFYKRDSSHNRDIEGSGIGLTIVKSILEGHEATYGVYNTSKGICFYFYLPAGSDESFSLS